MSNEPSNQNDSNQQPVDTSNNQPKSIEPSSLFSFDNKQQHTTTITLEDFSGASGNLLIENKE